MKEQHNQKKLSIYVTLLIVVICLFGISFALFKFNASQATQNDITTLNCFDVEYSDVTDAITLTNDFPISDADGLERSPYTFKIKNKCSQLLNVQIGVETLSTSQIQPTLIKGVITNKGETPTSAKLLSAGIPGTPVNGGTNYILLEDTIYGTQTKEYDLRLWFTESMTKEQGSGKTYQGKVTVISSPKTEEPVQFLTAIKRDNTVTETLTQPGKEVSAHTLDDVQVQTASVSSKHQDYYITYGTGWEANGTKFNLTGTAVTSDTYANSYSTLVGKYLINSYLESAGSSTAGTMKTTTDLDSVYYVVSATQNSFTYKQISSNKNTTEALLASTEDDYGTSYYFRGAVKNNYVQFANKCWRIVRVGGDGSVKLILHNDNTAGTTNPCNSANNSISAAFAHYNGDTYTSAFNTNKDDNTYVGFMYGTPGSSTYAATHANTNKSTILTNLETWYNNNLKTYESVIYNSVWCNDKTNVTDTTYNPWNMSNVNGLGYGKNVTYYGATQRLISTSGSTGGTGPSLKCNGELSKITSKIGLITADELAFAGYGGGLGNTTTYLQENATDDWWWSLSPYGFFFGSHAGVWVVHGSSGYFERSYVLDARGVRPSISLKSTTNVTGNGTSDTPYKIVS